VRDVYREINREEAKERKVVKGVNPATTIYQAVWV